MIAFRKILTTIALCLVTMGLGACLTLNTHSGIAEYARCFPAHALDSVSEMQQRNGRYYVKAEIVNAMIWRNKIDGMIDLGPFAAPGRRKRIQSRTGSYTWLPVSSSMAARLMSQGQTVTAGELVDDVTKQLRYRSATHQADGTVTPIAASIEVYREESALLISPEWQEKHRQANYSDYYSPFGATAPLQASGNFWARPAACLSAVVIDLPGSIVLSASAPFIVSVGLMCGQGPP